MRLCKSISAIALLTLLFATTAAQEKQTPRQPNARDASSVTAPLMVIDSFTHDFGEVKAGTPLRYVFKVKNQGNADLVINNVSPG